MSQSFDRYKVGDLVSVLIGCPGESAPAKIIYVPSCNTSYYKVTLLGGLGVGEDCYCFSYELFPLQSHDVGRIMAQ